ncbi:MAG: hypothetical protein ABI334_00495 [Candidatus Dormiibacterota bacterium]
MFRSILSRVVARGHIGRKRSFGIAVAIAMFVLPVATALAFYSATGSGTVVTNAAASPSSVVTIAANGGLTYAGPSSTNLAPGGTVSFSTLITCTAGCPADVTTINLTSWISNKSGCDMATLPGSFTMPTINVNNPNVTAGGVSGGIATITWVNLGVPQNACSGALFTFTLSTP